MPLRAIADGVFADVGPEPHRVVALHGWGRSRADWDGVLPEQGRIAVDLPGFGASPPPPDAWGAHDYARALAPAIEALPDPPVIVGHSFGGRVAVCLAADGVPVRGLVLAGVPLLRRAGGGSSPAGYRLVRWAHDRGLVSDERLEAARQKYGSADYRAASGIMRDVLVKAVNESYDAELEAIDVPVRLVWGADDTAARLEMAREAADLLADVELEVAEGVGHDVHRLRPELIRSAVEGLA